MRTAESAAARGMLGARDADVIRLRLPDTGWPPVKTSWPAAWVSSAPDSRCAWRPGKRTRTPITRRRAGRRGGARRAGLEMLSYPIWMWHWARPGDRRVPWPQACQVPLSADVAAKKKAAIGAFASQLTGREGAAGPVLPPGIVAHFTRPLEVLLR